MKASMFHVMRKTKSEQGTYSLLHPIITGLRAAHQLALTLSLAGTVEDTSYCLSPSSVSHCPCPCPSLFSPFALSRQPPDSAASWAIDLGIPRFSPLYMTVVGKCCRGMLIAPQVQMRVFGSCVLSFAWVALGRVIVEEG